MKICTDSLTLDIAAMSEVALYGTQGCTPLHFATMKGDVQLVKTLLKHGCDPEIMSHLAGATAFAGTTPMGLTNFHQGVIVYLDERLLTLGGGIQRIAVVWEISLAAQYSLQVLWKHWANKFPRMEGLVDEMGIEKLQQQDLKLHLRLTTWTKRVFVLGIGSLKAYNYTLGAQQIDQPVMKLAFTDSSVKIKSLDDHEGKLHCIEIYSNAPGFDFTMIMSFKSKTAKLEWLGSLRTRFSNRKELKKQIKNEGRIIPCTANPLI